MKRDALPQLEIDRLIEEHYAYEAADDVEGVLASLAADVEHDIVPSPFGPTRDKAQIRAFYEGLFANVEGRGITPLRRLYGEGFVVDEVIWHGRIVDGAPFGCPGRGGELSFRLLHIFEFEGGRISRENAWMDVTAIQQQLGRAAG